MSSKNQYLIPLILITSLFFLWGFAHNLNPILIPHLKKACQLTDLQSAFIDSSFFIGYFVMALPAGFLIKKYGYKAGIIAGLLMFAVGAFLFYPSAQARVFGLFLLALFIIASGLTFLETAANPYISVLGDSNSATQRLNFAQSFNGLAAAMAPLAGGLFILSGKTLTNDQLKQMTDDQLNTYLNHEASSVQIPYLIIGIVVLAVAFLLWKIHLPEIEEEAEFATAKIDKSIWSQKNLILGVVTQFFYVGAQVCISSFFIRFLGKTAGINDKNASFYLSVALFGFMVGRFIGTFLMKYISPGKLLALYSFAAIFLLGIAILSGGEWAVYPLIGVEFFMSIMFPTIFSLSIRGLGPHTKLGSSLVIMAIVGGAVFPVIMGKISDLSNIRIAYVVPLLCFLVVLYFGIQSIAVGKKLDNS